MHLAFAMSRVKVALFCRCSQRRRHFHSVSTGDERTAATQMENEIQDAERMSCFSVRSATKTAENAHNHVESGVYNCKNHSNNAGASNATIARNEGAAAAAAAAATQRMAVI